MAFFDEPADPRHLPEGMGLDWMDSEQSRLAEQLMSLTELELEGVVVDAEARRLIWPDGASLGIRQSAARLLGALESGHRLTTGMLERRIGRWLEMDYEPQDTSGAAMERFESEIAAWIETEVPERERL